MKRFLAVLLVAVMLMSILPATSMAASYATVVGGWLRLRSAPNFNATTITSYYTGTQVQIISSSGGWYKVQTPDGRIGYMYGDYLRVGGSIPSEGTAYVTSYNGYGVRLRTGPGTGYRIIRTYAVGTPVTVLERGTYWSRISIGGTVGYMMSQFLHFGSDYPDDGNVLCYATIWSSNGYGVRLRTGPSKSYSKIGVYSVGTKVAVLQKGAVWDRIRVGSRVGWMMNEFLIYHENNEVTSVTLNNYMPVVGSVLSMQAVAPNTATVSYEWLVGGVLKSTNTTYTVDANDVGKTIQLRVTGTGSYKGTVTSAATNAVVSNTVLTGVTLNTIAPVVGDVMTATLNPAGASVIYAWKVGGYQVSNAATYTVTANDVGKQIELIVTGTGVYSGTQSSGLTAAVSASRAIADVTIRNETNPTAGAAPSVGDKLTAVPSPAQATVTYQWNRDGAAISGATSASYTVAAEDEGHKLSVTVTGTGSYTGTDTSSETATVVVKAPVLGLIVPTFAEVVAGYEQPAAAALTITNTGSAGATITGVTSSDPARFIVNTNGSSQIAAGATDTSWTIQPAAGLAAGTYGATVTVTYDGGKTVSSTVSFVVKESAPAPASELFIGNLVFDPVQEGYQAVPEKAFTVTNTGAADVNVTSATLSGKNPTSFTLGGGATTIKAGATDSTTYTVIPVLGQQAGTYSATLELTYDNGKTAQADVTFTVSATAGTPSLTVGNVDFGSVAEGSTPGAAAISIENTGDVTATITDVSVDSQNFTVNTTGSTNIAADATDTTWTVQPVAGLPAGAYTGQITVTYNGAAPATAQVTLTVSGGSAPAEATLSVDGATVTQTVGELENIPITIRNTSAFDAAIRQVAINDTNNYFTVNGDGSSKIPANQSDASSWYVTPKANLVEGTYSTKVTVTYNSGAGTSDHTAEATITLNVSGSAPAPQALSVTLSFEEGSENMTVGQRIKLTANATGGDGSYQYSWDGGGTYVDASTWSYELVDGDAAKSPLSLWVIVQDGSGATATSNSITISVTNPSASTLDLLPSDNNMDTLQEEPAVSQTQTYTEPVQETYTEPVQETYTEPAPEPAAEPESQAPAAAVLTIQSKSSVTKGKTLQLTALMNDQAIVYDSNNDEAYPILWTLSGAKSKGTSISASGLLTVAADETATSLTVTATLKSDQNNFSTVNLKVKEAQTTETANTTTETVVNDDGTNDAGMELLDTLLNP
ncbi:MAG TPA: SH3 domain-containing protein [Candidatus Limiplasma pullistercoris]|nr:SH3 domain-containing protein [Candidatus Limiplasma pullistercoris]